MSDRLLLAVGASLFGHAVFARALEELPERPRLALPPTVQVRIVETPPPPPPPPPPPAPEPTPEPIKQVHERPRAKPIAAVARDVTPRDTPPVEIPTTATDTSTTPVFGTSMSSTSQGGTHAAPVGNTTRPTPGATGEPGAAKPLAPPVAAFEVTKMPVPQGRCSGKYTEAAREAAIEGSVVLDLIVGADGRARDIKVASGLGHGLTEAAIAALEACRFSPGERDGAPVSVRVRGFKIRFVLQE